MQRTVHQIKDAAGRLVAEHVRVVGPDGKKRMFWQRPGYAPTAGLAGLATADLPLYGTQYLRRLEPGRTVVVCEGESAAEALWSWRVPAVGTVTGAAGTPGEDALGVLLPFDVVLWPDHDEPGEAHMARIAGWLARNGSTARRLVWAGARDKGDDAADFVHLGGTPDTLDLMVQAAKPWRPEATAPTPIRAYRHESRDDSRVEEARAHLVEVAVGKLGGPVRRDARSLWWRCPFHAEKSPSFKVDLREPFYACFGCGARGDVFTFLQLSEGMAFPEALRMLAPKRALGGIPRLWA